MANTWMHNGFLQVEGEKMSKSLGNFVTINELLATDKFGGRRWDGDDLRLAMPGTHYTQPIDWTVSGLQQATTALRRWWREIGDVGPATSPNERVMDALADDMNTPKMLAELHSLRRDSKFADLAASLIFLGFTPQRHHGTESSVDGPSIAGAHRSELSAEATQLIEARAAARARKDFKESDRIRDELAAMGVMVKDGKGADGKPVTTWEIAR